MSQENEYKRGRFRLIGTNLIATKRGALSSRVLTIAIVVSLLASQCVAIGVARPAEAASPQPKPAQNNVYESTQDKGYRFERGGWIYVHLEGSPHDLGYQHGYLLAPEISDAFAAVSVEMTHTSKRDWNFF